MKQILRKSKKLKEVADCRTVFVCPDRTVEERAKLKKKVEERKRLRTVDQVSNSVIDADVT